MRFFPGWAQKASDWGVRHPGERRRATCFNTVQLHIYFWLRQASTRWRPHYYLAAVDISFWESKGESCDDGARRSRSRAANKGPSLGLPKTQTWNSKNVCGKKYNLTKKKARTKTRITYKSYNILNSINLSAVTACYSSINGRKECHPSNSNSRYIVFQNYVFGSLKHHIWGSTSVRTVQLEIRPRLNNEPAPKDLA